MLELGSSTTCHQPQKYLFPTCIVNEISGKYPYIWSNNTPQYWTCNLEYLGEHIPISIPMHFLDDEVNEVSSVIAEINL